MSLSPERRSRWLANMQAAGVTPDDGTVARVEPAIAERLAELDRVLEHLDFHERNPDYLRSRSEAEAVDGNA